MDEIQKLKDRLDAVEKFNCSIVCAIVGLAEVCAQLRRERAHDETRIMEQSDTPIRMLSEQDQKEAKIDALLEKLKAIKLPPEIPPAG